LALVDYIEVKLSDWQWCAPYILLIVVGYVLGGVSSWWEGLGTSAAET